MAMQDFGEGFLSPFHILEICDDSGNGFVEIAGFSLRSNPDS